jgi:hypothetical protein
VIAPRSQRAAINGKRSLVVVQRRITKHLTPIFRNRRLASITAADVTSYIAHRITQGIVPHKGPRAGQRIADVSNAEINRELATLKRIFNLAIEQDRIAMKPTIKMLHEWRRGVGFAKTPSSPACSRTCRARSGR